MNVVKGMMSANVTDDLAFNRERNEPCSRPQTWNKGFVIINVQVQLRTV